MRINSIPPQNLYCQYIYVKDKAADPPKYTSGTDKVELTKEAKSFSAALKAVKESIDTQNLSETKKIEKIKQQITDGTYNVSGYKVAEKMLDD